MEKAVQIGAQKYIFIGFDEKGREPIGSEETRKQIEEVTKLDCMISDRHGPLTWAAFERSEHPVGLFQQVLQDREMRVDKKIPMSTHPQLIVITVEDEKVIRLEYYEADREFEMWNCIYDFRAEDLKSAVLYPSASFTSYMYRLRKGRLKAKEDTEGGEQ